MINWLLDVELASIMLTLSMVPTQLVITGGQVGQARCHQPDSPDDIGIAASQESHRLALTGYLPRAETDEKGGTLVSPDFSS